MNTILAVAVVLHLWVGWRIAPALAAFAPAGTVLWLTLAFSAVLMPVSFLMRRRHKGPAAMFVTWAGLLCMGLFSTLLVLTVLRDGMLVLALITAMLGSLFEMDSGWLNGLQSWSALAVLVMSLAATIWGFWTARRTATVVRVDVPITGLPAALHGFTLAQISDVHVGPTIKGAYVQRIVARVNSLGVDMVAITGDLIDGSVEELRSHVAPLAGLVSRHGTFFVTGNHEYYAGAHAWITELRSLGIDVLLNEHRVLQHDAGGGPETAGAPVAPATLVVAGVTDYGARQFDESQRSDPVAALAGAPANSGLRLLLAHQPRSAPAASQAGFDLQISGHTHGGQFWPWMYFVRLQQPFTAGLGKLGKMWVYTNRGTGYWGPPQRFGVSSEITHLRLVTG
ncbi:MAG: metallophosphoesterase [Burkholderiaceae bacterium]